MKKFLLYIFILILPLLVLLPLPIYCLYMVGELKPFDSYIHRLEKDQLWGLAYSYYDREYKYFMTEKLKSDIVVLGTSRSMQIEENIFNKKYSFYNAGGAAQNSQDFLEFVKNLTYNPNLIVIDINQFFFNSKSDKSPKAIYKKPKLNGNTVLKSSLGFYEDLIMGKIDFNRFSANNNIGLLARMKEDGFTDTGFYYYGRIMNNIKDSQDYNFENTMERIKTHSKRFQTCNDVDMSAVNHIDSFLKECKKRGIMVVGFLPPFAHKTNEAMKKDGNYQYVSQIYDKLLFCFDGETQFLFDYTDATKIGGEDYNFIDGFHAGVIVDNLIFKDMISKNEKISNFFVSPEYIDSVNMEYMEKHPKFHDLPSIYSSSN